ncbi:hypothetical protein HOP50_13g67960 [Chloropicon primus]|uniref:Uncharacterized protein n=1 Tax=Chloropicon primus TaxID=1764295 RepID=A0A5B8MXP9_9CHLO|nr:hypothetical protein A3770_13p67780 [Chloropicon primus]UPR03467.1 hypothetical protein HOP50_13g67960 [Chloropicon primus]|eukprot:QDZ24260.1 hypothetical protein A3770_13p67780 [Chloropicon primus]
MAGTDVEKDELAEGHKRCGKMRKLVAQRTNVHKPGTREYNRLVGFIKCNIREDRKERREGDGGLLEEAFGDHQRCFLSFMGSGQFQGRSNCAKEMEEVLKRLEDISSR